MTDRLVVKEEPARWGCMAGENAFCSADDHHCYVVINNALCFYVSMECNRK